jgi:hypothetical protein
VSTTPTPEPKDVSQEVYLTPEERAGLQRILSKPEEFPREFGAWIKEYMSIHGEVQPYQIAGFAQRTPKTAQVTTEESTGWTSSYVNLATNGPELTDLAKGTYLVTYGAQVKMDESGSEPWLSVSINGAAPSDTNGMFMVGATSRLYVPMAKALLLDLDLPSNALKVQYKRIGTGATVALFSRRYIHAIRVGNL